MFLLKLSRPDRRHRGMPAGEPAVLHRGVQGGVGRLHPGRAHPGGRGVVAVHDRGMDKFRNSWVRKVPFTTLHPYRSYRLQWHGLEWQCGYSDDSFWSLTGSPFKKNHRKRVTVTIAYSDTVTHFQFPCSVTLTNRVCISHPRVRLGLAVWSTQSWSLILCTLKPKSSLKLRYGWHFPQNSDARRQLRDSPDRAVRPERAQLPRLQSPRSRHSAKLPR